MPRGRASIASATKVIATTQATSSLDVPDGCATDTNSAGMIAPMPRLIALELKVSPTSAVERPASPSAHLPTLRLARTGRQ